MTALISNPTIDLLLRHRTHRAFTDDPVDEATLATLFEVARRGATTSYNQQFTIIHIQDEQLRQEIAAVTGQAHVAGTKGELFIFVIDLYRNACIRQAADADLVHASRMNAYMAGHNDAAIGAQNMVIAAESLGLGTVYLGSINADPRRMIELLGLPAYTYPAFGLLVGHPASEPERKPRLPLSVTVAVDRYPVIDDPVAFVESLAEYDAEVQEYYGTRASNTREDSFTHLIQTRQGLGAAERSPMREVFTEQKIGLY